MRNFSILAVLALAAAFYIASIFLLIYDDKLILCLNSVVKLLKKKTYTAVIIAESGVHHITLRSRSESAARKQIYRKYKDSRLLMFISIDLKEED